jgi:hypothetical protein
MKIMGIRMRGWALGMGVLSLMLPVLVVPRSVHARATPAQPCAASGTYAVGSSPANGSVPGAGAPRVVAPVFPLSGTLTLTGFTGCGTPTSGQFQVRASRTVGPLPGMHSSSGATQTATGTAYVIPFFSTTVISATGTFRQDPAHSADSSYVLVSATVGYGQIGIRCVGVCLNTRSHSSIACLEPPCPGTSIITTRIVSFQDITGYLRLQSGGRPMLGLMFLPPPDPRLTSLAAALSLQPVSFWGTKTS